MLHRGTANRTKNRDTSGWNRNPVARHMRRKLQCRFSLPSNIMMKVRPCHFPSRKTMMRHREAKCQCSPCRAIVPVSPQRSVRCNVVRCRGNQSQTTLPIPPTLLSLPSHGSSSRRALTSGSLSTIRLPSCPGGWPSRTAPKSRIST